MPYNIACIQSLLFGDGPICSDSGSVTMARRRAPEADLHWNDRIAGWQNAWISCQYALISCRGNPTGCMDMVYGPSYLEMVPFAATVEVLLRLKADSASGFDLTGYGQERGYPVKQDARFTICSNRIRYRHFNISPMQIKGARISALV